MRTARNSDPNKRYCELIMDVAGMTSGTGSTVNEASWLESEPPMTLEVVRVRECDGAEVRWKLWGGFVCPY